MRSEPARLASVAGKELSAPVLERTATFLAFLSHPLVMVVADLACAVAAYLLAWIIRMSIPLPYTQDLLPQERWDVVGHPWAALLLTQIFFLYMLGLYDDLRALRVREIVVLLFFMCGLQVITVTSLFFFTNQVFPRSVILIFDAVNFLFLGAWHIYVKKRTQALTLRVLVVGESAEAAREILADVRQSPWMGLEIVGLVTCHEGEEAVEGMPVLGSVREISDIVREQQVDQIIFASQNSWKDEVLNSLSQLQGKKPIRIAILPSVYEIVIGRLQHLNIRDTPLIEVRRNPSEPVERLVKRAFDFGLSSLLLLLLAPLCLLLALLIKLLSPGPVFYTQERVGKGGRVFRLIKFRTMIPDAERETGEVLADVNDPRVTPIGRFLRRTRLDEVPQLINVWKGDMSFVGPRPERPKFVEEFARRVPGYHERHKVKPGITGLAQVKSSYDTRAENKLRYDLAYLYNYSFSLDLLILLETIKVILLRKGSQ